MEARSPASRGDVGEGRRRPAREPATKVGVPVGTEPELGAPTLACRREELARLQHFVRRAAAGDGAAITVVGAPGSGRTTLLDALVASGVCSYLLRLDGIRSEAGVPGAGLSRLRADMAGPPGGWDCGPELASSDSGDEVARLRCAESLVECWSADGQPCLVAVDDFHHLDYVSAEVLALAARRLHGRPVAMVVTASEDGRRGLLEGLEQITLGPLPSSAVYALLQSTAGSRVAPAVANQLINLTGANPLGIVEVVSRLTPAVLAGVAPIPDPLPVGERVTTAFDLAQIDDSTGLATLAVAMTERDPDALSSVLGTLGVGDEALDEANHRGLVRNGIGGAQLAHPLIGPALQYRLTPSQHRQVKIAVASNGQAAVPSHARGQGVPGPSPAPGSTTEVRLLGDFAVLRGESDCTPRGSAGLLVKMVCALEKVSLDQVGEELWPNGEPGEARRRLRNVLSRARAACGEVVLRDGEMLQISPDVVVDVLELETVVNQAAAEFAAGRPAASFAQRAIELYRGEFLPADRYAGWTTVIRERLLRRHIDMLQILVAAAVDADDVREAVRLLEQSIELDRYNEAHYDLAARLLVERGWLSKAVLMVRRARSAMDELGLALSPSLVSLAARAEGPQPR